MPEVKLSIVILNYKVPYHLLLCLKSVEKALQNIDAEIIVVDNDSQDESADLVKTHFPDVILIQNQTNEGFSRGNNRGVKVVKGEYLCLLNPDTVVAETTFENLLKFAEKHPDFGAIGPRLIDGTGNFLPESKRNFPTPKIAFQKFLGNGENYYAHHLKEEETGNTPVLTGACLLMKTSRYREIGGLDEDYFMYGEDIDLCYSFQKSNYKNFYLGSEIILHFKGESSLKDAEYAKRFFGAMQLFYQKHFKSHFLMDTAVKLAVWMAITKKRFSAQPKQNKTLSVRKIYWITRNNTEKARNQYSKNSETLLPEDLNTQRISEAMLIFDAASISFAEIIDLIQVHKNQNNKFRIKPPDFDFYLGSDNSFEKGEVKFPEALSKKN